MRPEYAELEAKTNFSFLRGASHPEEMVLRANELGLTALALADFDGVYGLPKAYWENKKHSGLKLIAGASLKLADERLTLLARDRAAYGLLCRLLTKSHAGKEKGGARLEFAELEAQLEAHPGRKGLIALAPAHASFARLRPLFGEGRLYLTLQRLLDGHDDARTEKSTWLEKRWRLPIVATNDAHYHDPARQPLQDALTAVRENTPLPRLGHALFPNAERHLKSPAAMHALFRDRADAIENTLLIAGQCTFCPSELKYRYPSEWIPAGLSAQAYLAQLVEQGLRRRYGENPAPAVGRQIAHELSLIAEKGYADYFLTIFDIMEFARGRKILCQGRGSAANSVVCYVLGITAIDPLQMNLLFERFLSVERNEPPDIDVDFEHDRREEVLQYVYEKYGRDRAAMVSAVVTYRTRSAFRELAKALDVNVGAASAKEVEKEFDERAAGAGTRDPRAHVERLAGEMAGFPRHLSIHSGGFTLSADPIIELVPVEPARMEGRTIIQWDKADLDYLGLLKVDLLSLGMLTALRRTLDMVGKNMYAIPHDDPATYAMIQRTDTVGTFQIESRAQMSMLGRLKPANFYDLVIEVAIVRPGPIVGKMVHPYLRRRRGEEKVTYPHPKLREILGKTLGVPLFQEQVMKMAIELGGFTPGEADELRRAIGAWRSSGSIDRMGRKLVAGFRRNGLDEEFAERVYQQIQGFAQYGFPESHSASFALLAYFSCYLKCHHPAEFTCGLLNSLPMGFYAAHSLVDDAKRHRVRVLPVCPQASGWECSVLPDGALRLGWNMVRGVNETVVNELVAARPFSSLADFLRRAPLKRDVLIRLALGDAFRGFGRDPRAALWEVLETQRRQKPTQGELFLDTGYDARVRPQSAGASEHQFRGLNSFESVREEYSAFGLATAGHPMTSLRQLFPVRALNTRSARAQRSGSRVTVAGLILVRQRPPTAKGMTFSTLEDEQGLLDIAIPPQRWEDEKLRRTFLDHCFLVVTGKLQRDGHSASVMVTDLRPIIPSEKTREGGLFIEPTQYFH